MEPSKISDECSSSESGWTTYLASPIHDDNNYEKEDDENEDEDEDEDEDQIGTHKQANKDENEDKSDDSMASDASSGPSQIEVSYGRSKKGHLFGQNKSKTFSGKKHSEQVQKVETFQAEKEITRGNAYTPTCYSKTAAKVRKTKKMGKK